MGWAVVAKTNINVDAEHNDKIIEKLKEFACGELGEIMGSNGSIYCEIWGNKMIDYTALDKLVKFSKDNNIQIKISAIEYVESEGEGYYYNSGDEK